MKKFAILLGLTGLAVLLVGCFGINPWSLPSDPNIVASPDKNLTANNNQDFQVDD